MHGRRKEVQKKGLPEIVWVGSSHIRWFEDWYLNENQGIKKEDRDFLEMAGWAASGGAKLHTFNERLSGEKLPIRQRHLGDQWSDVIVWHPYPFAVVLSMGSNDVSDMYQILMRQCLEDKKSIKTGTETRWFRWAFRRLTRNAKLNVQFMKMAYPKAQYFYINVIDRPG